MLGMLSCVLAHHSLPDSFKPPKTLSKPEIITSSKSFTYGSSPRNSDALFQVRSYRGEKPVYFDDKSVFHALVSSTAISALSSESRSSGFEA